MKVIRAAAKGFTLIELMIVVAIIGILAAIAIPDFIKFQARSKTGEAKANLKGIFTAQRSYYQEHDTFGCAFLGGTAGCAGIGYAPERGNRYALSMGLAAPTNWQIRTTANLTAVAAGAIFDGIEGDVFKFPSEFAAGGNVSATGQQVVGTGAVDAVTYTADTGITVPATTPGTVVGPQGSFAAVAAGNIDSETTGIDKWYIASQGAAVTAGNCVIAVEDLQVAAGVPGRVYNDVDCDN
jgi:type IV pilus assembly protein PilA